MYKIIAFNVTVLCCAKWLQLCPTLQPRGLQPTRTPSMGFSRQEYWSELPFPLLLLLLLLLLSRFSCVRLGVTP